MSWVCRLSAAWKLEMESGARALSATLKTAAFTIVKCGLKRESPMFSKSVDTGGLYTAPRSGFASNQDLSHLANQGALVVANSTPSGARLSLMVAKAAQPVTVMLFTKMVTK